MLEVAGTVININFATGPEDIDFADYFPYGIRINSVTFVASAATDVLVLKDRTATGVAVVTIVGNGTISWAQPIRAHLFMDKSACTLNTAPSCQVIIQLA